MDSNVAAIFLDLTLRDFFGRKDFSSKMIAYMCTLFFNVEAPKKFESQGVYFLLNGLFCGERNKGRKKKEKREEKKKDISENM